MNKPAKIKDIAESLGLSPATVSRALSDSKLVTEETRKRVREAADALNYRPNVSARNLRTARSMAVLMVVRDVGNPFYLDILKSVEATARAAGYSVLMGNTENDPQRETEYFDMLRDGHADGMILMTGKLPEAPAGSSLLPDGAPIVVALEVVEGVDWPHVKVDNEAAARAAVQHLIELGHRRIAYIGGPRGEGLSLTRDAGYRAAMKEAGLSIPEGYLPHGDYLLSGGQQACRALFSLPQPPTAIFTANDEMAYGAIHELHARGLSVPDDVSVVGFDDLYLSEAFTPPLTTVHQPREEVGRQAMRILLALLSGKSTPEEPVVLPTTLKVRGTTAPPRV